MQQSKSPAPGAVISPDGATVAWTLRRTEGAQIHLTSVTDPSKDTVLKVDSDRPGDCCQ